MDWKCLFQLLWCCTWWSWWRWQWKLSLSRCLSVWSVCWLFPAVICLFLWVPYVCLIVEERQKDKNCVWHWLCLCLTSVDYLFVTSVCLTCVSHWWSLYRPLFLPSPPPFHFEIWRKILNEFEFEKFYTLYSHFTSMCWFWQYGMQLFTES